MTPEELDEATAKEVQWRWGAIADPAGQLFALKVAARLAREGWTPSAPVDPDILAFREWATVKWPSSATKISEGKLDYGGNFEAYLAGARMATERERERAKVLVERVRHDAARLRELSTINDFDETVADGGITAGMVCRQEIAQIADSLSTLIAKYEATNP